MRLQILGLLVLFAMIYEYHCNEIPLNDPEKWNWTANYELNTKPYKPYKDNYNKDNDDNYNKDNDDNYNNDNDNDNKDNDNDSYDNDAYYNNDNNYESSEYRSSRTRKSPDSYGNMNLYFREPSKDGKRKKPKKIRFPVHQFKRDHFPRFPPLLSFLPWLPIFADRLTKQTIIYSPAGGVYIIPPVINFYGERFSIAELIASGYVSLVSSGAPPPPAVDVAPLVQPGAVTGPSIPPPNPATGGFKGGVRTEYRSFSRPKYPKTFEEQGSTFETESRSASGGGGYGY